MVKIQSVVLLFCLGMAYAGGYGNSFNRKNYYPYTGNYVGSHTRGQYGGYSGNGYTGYGKSFSGHGSSYGTNVYKNMVLPHPYPLPYPVPVGGHTGSRTFLVRNGGSMSDSFLGLGDNGILGFIFLLIILPYILQLFNGNQNQNQIPTTTPSQG